MSDFELPDWARKTPTGPWLLIGVVAVFVIVVAFTGFITIPADSVGVRTRFGKFVDILPSGINFKIPLGVDTVQIVPIQRQLKLEFGFSTEVRGSTNPNQFPDDAEAERNMVTGDLNMAL